MALRPPPDSTSARAGQQAPIEPVCIGFGYEYVSILLIGTMVIFQELAEDCLPQIKLFAIFRDVLIGVDRASRNSQNSCKNQTG